MEKNWRKWITEYTNELVSAANLIAQLAHKGQKDKSGVDYINHPRTVASYVSSNKEKIVALLHDVVEDTELTIEGLYPVFGKEICDALNLMTHNDNTPYFDYIRNIKNNSLATSVKLADLKHNSDISRIPNPGPKDYNRIKKYKKAEQILLGKEE